jgi:hypothetical protein
MDPEEIVTLVCCVLNDKCGDSTVDSKIIYKAGKYLVGYEPILQLVQKKQM